jgi:transcriptional regulator with XRE-family HTH domain
MREARDASKLTQAEVAAELCLSRQVITKWESGRSAPNPVQLLRLCTLYGVSADWMLAGVRTVPAEVDPLLKGILQPRDFADSQR